MILIIMSALLTSAYATHSRNALWQSEISLWEDAVKKSPFSVRGRYNLAVAYQNEGMLDEAVEQYELSILINPNNIKAGGVHYNLGLLYSSKGYWDKAIEHYEAALRLKPDLPDVRFNLATAYLKKGNTDKARRELESILKMNPYDHRASKLMGRIGEKDFPEKNKKGQ
jgi:tetratricopeptide (TPR) repeat protein